MTQFSGKKANIYAVIKEEDTTTLFDHFIIDNKVLFLSELKDIISRLQTIGKRTGAQEYFFKLKEGKPGDGVCALYDNPNSNLRLYCIRYGNDLIVVGGGGHKPKSIRALQEDAKLKAENELLKWLSQEITKRTTDGTIIFSEDGFEGELIIEDYEA
ncbi:MAG: hypothetical protein RIC80_03515 [Cyclobacteriaceae bacterium]